MLSLATIMLSPTRRLSLKKTNIYPRHFVSIWTCSACLVGILLGEKQSFHLENEVK